MKVLYQFFDYTYYRIAKKYFKRDGIGAFRALILLAVFQSLIIFDLVVILLRLNYIREQLSAYISLAKIFLFTILILFYIYNYKRYKGRYLEFRDKWINEEKKRKIINGILMIIILFIPIIIGVIIGLIK